MAGESPSHNLVPCSRSPWRLKGRLFTDNAWNRRDWYAGCLWGLLPSASFPAIAWSSDDSRKGFPSVVSSCGSLLVLSISGLKSCSLRALANDGADLPRSSDAISRTLV
jgi:hypothetical protein